MKISPPPRRPPVGEDHEHVEWISGRATAILLIVIAIVVYEIQWIFLPFVISSLLAYICTPAVDWATARTRLPRALFAVIAFVVILAVAAGVGFLGVPPLVEEATHIINDFQQIIETFVHGLVGQARGMFGQQMNAQQLAQNVAAGITDWIGRADMLLKAGAVGFATIFGVFLTIVLLFYFLVSGPRIWRGVFWLVPPRQRPLVRRIWTRLDPVLKRYFVGVLGVMVYASAAAYVGLGIALELPHAVFLALLTGILEMLPMIGPGAAAVIAGLVAIQNATSIEAIIGYAIYAAALRLSIDQFLGPLALGAASKMHPIVIIFCFLVGGLLFGIVGVILAVPVALAVRVTLSELYDEPPVETKQRR